MAGSASIVLAILSIVVIYLIYVSSCEKKHVQPRNSCSKSLPRPKPSLGFMADREEDFNHESYLLNNGLESSVLDSHRNFVDEMQMKTTGASALSVMSHDDSIVPKWGLRRSTPMVNVDPNAREVPSSTNEQLKDNSGTNQYGFF